MASNKGNGDLDEKFNTSVSHHDHAPASTVNPRVAGNMGGPLNFANGDQAKPTRSMSVVIRNAKNATEKEHCMSLWQGIKLYPKAVAWSVLISTCICMEGYDVCLLSNFYGFPQFNKKYGKKLPDGTYQVPAPWQAGLSNGANVGRYLKPVYLLISH